jgi:hypothetical protein
MFGAKATAEWASRFGNMLQAAAGNPRYPALAAMWRRETSSSRV